MRDCGADMSHFSRQRLSHLRKRMAVTRMLIMLSVIYMVTYMPVYFLAVVR